jgi:hypothetical protein
MFLSANAGIRLIELVQSMLLLLVYHRHHSHSHCQALHRSPLLLDYIPVMTAMPAA